MERSELPRSARGTWIRRMVRLWVAPGSFAYSLAADPAMRGCLYRVAQPSEVELREDSSVLVAQE
eukprot:2797972-Prymnesium_polylepis.1